MSAGARQGPASAVDPPSPVARAWWTVAGLTVVLWGFQLFGYVDIYPAISVAVIVLGAWGIGTYRQNDSVDVRYEAADGSPRLAEGLEIESG